MCTAQNYEDRQPSFKARQDCLIRPYLGRRRRPVRRSRFHAFNLRNYPFRVDQIEDLALGGILYARIIAETLADSYWRAHVDANAVKFVLALRRGGHTIQPNGQSAHPTIVKSHNLGEYVVWILDCDCCKHMPLDETGVDQSVVAFYKNDSFYPRPRRDNIKDNTLWNECKDRFLKESEVILGQRSAGAHMPVL